MEKEITAGSNARTSKRTVMEEFSPDAHDALVRAPGAAAWSMHSSDSYWFATSESPTNAAVFPRHALSSFRPSNLRSEAVEGF